MIRILCLFFVLLFIGACIKPPQQPETAEAFVQGADIGWLPQMEATGYIFKNEKGEPEDCLKILKDHGINAVRLRTWVNPSSDPFSGHCSTVETVALAKRAKAMGMKIMLNFHYSDSWADPGKQIKPAAWASHPFSDLLAEVYTYTRDVMLAMQQGGVTPDWVQVGNEITNGMLHPEGHTDQFGQLVQLLNQGYNAVKSVSPRSQVVLHIDQGNNIARCRWWYAQAALLGARYDMIGLSYYPYWLDGNPDYTLSINDLETSMRELVQTHGKPLMVVEVGGEDTKPDNTYDMLKAVISRVKNLPNQAGKGVMYWEPQGARSWSRYALSAWGNDGRPTRALQAFR